METTENYLKRCIKTAFNFEKHPVYGIDIVYPERSDEDQVNQMFDRWVKIVPSTYKAHIEEDNDEDDNDDSDNETVTSMEGEEGQNESGVEPEAKSWMFKKRKVSSYRKKASIAEMMEDSSADRDMR